MPKKLRTKDLCREALEQTGWVLQYVPDCFKTKKAPLAGEAKRVLLAAGVCACLGDMAA
ncbi:MAG: hypothetical protein II595_04870 [Desulfovibrio sp.]|nr:hypothetical protein [Desulfovibrio sp.]